MPAVDRRRFLQIAGGATAATMLEQSIARAAALPGNHATGTLRDIDHIVVLMQENRSFDHYFGTMRGVRGFGDPHPVTLPNGRPVWNQSDGTRDILPFRPDMEDLGLVFLEDLPHSWTDTQNALNVGHYDQWVPNKGTTSMAHLRRGDAPFHHALADAFTICDDYYCSFLGNTDPNRYYMWTGWTGNDGKGGGPVLYNDELGYDWMTYPQRLQKAGVSWKIYQDIGLGLDQEHYWGWTDDAYIGNYGDNSLLYFHAYQNAAPGSPLYRRARTGTDTKTSGSYFDVLRKDVQRGRLPQISWVVAPEAFSEHPNWPVNFGAWYVSQVLDALTSNPEVWARTALLVTYDENDGFFDHVVPALPNSPTIPGESTVPLDNEFYSGPLGPGTYGLGPRVPMLVISPWSTGGWVCSETLDHTSIIRLMEKRFGVVEPNITPWRRAVCGDLTSAFDFSRSKPHVPALPETAQYEPRDHERHPDYKPTPPTTGKLPKQERGTRPARATGYRLTVRERSEGANVGVTFENHSRIGTHFQARFLGPVAPPHSYTVGAGDRLDATWPAVGPYDIALHGPQGFFRGLRGNRIKDHVRATLRDHGDRLELVVSSAHRPATVTLTSAYRSGEPKRVHLAPGRSHKFDIDTRGSGGWYDLKLEVQDEPFVRQFAGHLENGRPSVSDPQLGG